MLSSDAESSYDLHHSGGTLRSNSAWGVVGGTMVLSDCGGFIRSAGGAGISIFGTKRVNGFPQPTKNKKENATRNFIVQSPLSSKACQAN
jgi:hypothetical protein